MAATSTMGENLQFKYGSRKVVIKNTSLAIDWIIKYFIADSMVS